VGLTTDTRIRPPSGQDVAAVIAGDRDATDAFVGWMWPRAKQVAFLMAQDQGLAEDVAQEAVLKALKALPSFDRTRPVKPWAERIAVNATLDRLRKRHLWAEVSQEDHAGLDEEQLEAEATELVRQAVSDDVMEALRTLSEVQRSAVVLRYLLDCTPSEIAEISDIPASTVRSHVRRGLIELRQILKHPGGEQ